MKRIKMKVNVTVHGDGWTTRYRKGSYYGENHVVFLKDRPETYEYEQDENDKDKD